LGFGIELTQLLFNLILRYPYRVVDITDALLNAAGVLIGYALFRLFSRLFIAITSILPASPTGLLAYIQDVASRA
jgi:glycopeptide antibiotics resistance protein